ncbi:BspA family leucine-rich repeat surface protein [Segatella copri]|uniref:BspA family leucine-rich repeat surface protein n=1 Tax=Segatella copri TaxID=165179 RepID=UPI00294AAE34|nr:BspA family leucine-rich repeat surface protein [Segatella copri]WOF98407.1 BspA family leucine-rich repeat surface protein [Segatella copri]
MKKNTNQFNGSHADRINNGGGKFRRIALFPLMLFMLLFVPTRMVAQTDPRCALFNSLDGITDVTITDNGDYPWQMMDLKAEGMTDISFEIPEGSTGLMSSNYNVEGGSTSETVVNFKVEKPIFLTFKHLVSSESYCDKATITIDNKKFEEISEIRQIEIKESLSAGEHTLKLSYQKDYSGNNNADRTFIYNLKTATSISDNNYIAEYNAKNTTLTFKKVIDANISDIGNNSVIVEKYNNVGEICKALGNVTIKNIVFEESFKTYAPTSLKEFFYNCKTLETISGLEYLNTANITDMSSMFQECSNLKSLDFTNFDTKNVSNMYFMFNNCPNLTSLDLTDFNTKNVKNMNGMFCDCSNLTSLDITNFNTAKVTNMGNMFLGCSNLTSLDLTNFNTAKVTDMHGMFKGCSALTSLDLTNFNTAEVRDMNRMFNMLDESSTALTTIYVSDNFVTTNVQNGENMFKNCTKLKGFQKYFLLDTDHQYANYKTGYFTKLVGKNGEEKIGAVGKTLATENLVLDDGKDFVAYEPFTATTATYSRSMNAGTTWGTLCLPFAIDQSKETECKFYSLTGIDNDNECITLESYEGAEIPAGTPVLFKMNEGEQKLSISAQNAEFVKEPVAGTNTDVNLVGSFTKIGGNGNQGLDKNDYIIGKDKFWLVSELKKDGKGKGVGIKPMRAYIYPATVSQARAAMLSIGKGDGTTAIDNLNAISNDANAEYYDANGRRTNGLQKGLNIVKRGSKTYKIMVK